MNAGQKHMAKEAVDVINIDSRRISAPRLTTTVKVECRRRRATFPINPDLGWLSN